MLKSPVDKNTRDYKEDSTGEKIRFIIKMLLSYPVEDEVNNYFIPQLCILFRVIGLALTIDVFVEGNMSMLVIF